MKKSVIIGLVIILEMVGVLGKGADSSSFSVIEALNALNVRGNFEYPDIDFDKEGINYTHIYTLFLNDENAPVGLTHYRKEYANATLISRFFHRDLFFKGLLKEQPEAITESLKVQAFAMNDQDEIVLFSDVANLSLGIPQEFFLKFDVARDLSREEYLTLQELQEKAKAISQREFSIIVELDLNSVVYNALPESATLFVIAIDQDTQKEIARYQIDQFENHDEERVVFTDDRLLQQGKSIADYPRIEVEAFISSTEYIQNRVGLIKGDKTWVTPNDRDQYILLYSK